MTNKKFEIRIHPEDIKMQSILGRCNSILNGYKPTFWCYGTFLQLVWLILREWYYLNTIEYERVHLVRPDKGTVCIDIAKSDSISPDAPIVLFLHTISGSSNTTNSFVQHAMKRGWRAIVLNRRGHDHPLTSPRFNLMGDVDDTVAMIKKVKSIYKKSSFLAAIGISAGSGQVVSYIGREGSNVDISAAVSLCPAYDISKAFGNLDKTYPSVANLLLKRIKKYFLLDNDKILQSMTGYSESLQTKNLHDFVQTISTLAGAKNWTDYLKKHNPMSHYTNNKTPCLIINSIDDPVCVKENIPEIKVLNYALLLTERGSHIAFTEGLMANGSWMERVALDFLESCRLEILKKKGKGTKKKTKHSKSV